MAQKIMVKVNNSTRVHVRGINAPFFYPFLNMQKQKMLFIQKTIYKHSLQTQAHTNMLDDCKDKK